jgi:hypothetical protein
MDQYQKGRARGEKIERNKCCDHEDSRRKMDQMYEKADKMYGKMKRREGHMGY